MPSGSKKRKSSKKPKPPGGPPELEAGLEEAMENNGLEVGEATPSPRGFEGDPEAMAERCLQEGKEMNGKAPQERDAVPEVPKEGFQTDEAAPDQGEEGQGSPPSQAEPELKIPAGIEAEAPAVFELEGEPAQGETKLQIDTPPMEFEVKTDAAPEEIKPETELDAVPAESEPVSDAAPEEIKPEMESHAMPVEPESVTDASPDASPDEIKPDSYIGLDEIESSKESSILERESVLDAAPIGSESGMDESSVAMETKTDAASADIEPEIYKARDEVKPETDAAPAIESEISEPLVEVKPEADATPYIELETNDAPIGSESGMDESSVATETKTDVASADIEPEIYKAPDEVKAETDAAPAIESEISEPLVEVKPEADATPYIELETNDASYEVPVEVEPEMDGAPVESKPETEAAQVEELEPAAPAEIEPETEEALMERELETDAAPTDVEAEAEEALAETEVAIDAAPVDVEPVMDAAPADAEAETDTAQVEIDASPDEIPPEIDAASPENERIEIEPDVNAAPVEAEQDEAAIEAAPEPESEVEGEPEVIAEDADTSAEVEAETEPPPETEPEPKPLDVAEDTSLQPPQEIELLEVAADTSLEPPQGIEPLDVADDTSLEPPQEIEPESEVVATAEAKPEEEASVETKAEERGSAEAESDQQDLVEGEMEAPLEINPEPEAQPSREIELDAEAELPLEAEPEPVAEARAEAESEAEPSRGIEMDAEAEVPLEAEPEPVAEAPAEAEPEEKGSIETESYQQDLGEIEPDQQLQKQEGGEAELGELDTSVSEDNQPSESQPQVADAPELPVIEDEPPAISPVDDFSSSTSSSEASDNVNNERTASEQEPEEGDDIPPSAKASEGEGHSTVEGVSDNQGAFEQKAVDVGHDGDGAVLVPAGNGIETEKSSEQESAIEPPPADVEEYAQEDISKQERSVDVGHDEDGAVLASAGNGGEAEESSEQELAIELPSADVEESAKEEISEQERAVDVGHDEDGAVLASAGNGGKVEVSSEQELGIELPPADVVDLEELAKDGPPSSDQGPVTEQPQPLVDEQDLSQGLGTAADEPLSAESEQSLNATLAPSASEMTSDAPDTQEEVITLANEEKVALEHAFNLESACGELERDIGEEEAVSSTVVEVGSVLNDFDERTSYEQELHTDFPSVDQEVDIPSAESDQSLNAITAVAPEPQDETVIPANDDEKVALEHEFKLESACGELERDIGEEVMVASSTGGEAGSVLNDFDERASYEQELHTDFPSSTHQDVDIPDFKEYDGNVSTEAYEAEAGLREQVESEPSLAEKVDESAVEATSEQRDVLLEGAEAGKPAEDSPQPKQVVHDNGDQAHSSKEVVLPNEELRTGEEERATCEDGRVAANSIFGNSLAIIAGDELISKASTCLENGQQSLSSSEAPSNERVEHIYESSIHQSEVNNMDKAEIHAMDAKELKEAEHNPMGGDTNIDANKVLVESAPLIPEGKYTKGAQAFRQESTKEASLPVVVPAQDRALEHVSLKSAERPSGGGALERRTKLLGCCGMFDLLLGRN